MNSHPTILGSFKTPVALFLYNRARHTQAVLERLVQIRPCRLYVVADGPKAEIPDDAARCEEVRRLVRESITWECEVSTLYGEKNIGCGRNVSAGLAWVFSCEERAIILEDDCVPDLSFFPFCEELLQRYRDVEEVAQICGSNPCGKDQATDECSYLFSRFGPVWGWASWRRAWGKYDFNLNDWPSRDGSHWLNNRRISLREKMWRRHLYQHLWSGEVDTWDYQWGYAKFRLGLLSIVPNVNLIENIGFGVDATHTRADSCLPMAGSLEFPLKHPDSMQQDYAFDAAFASHQVPSWSRLLWQYVKATFMPKKGRRG